LSKVLENVNMKVVDTKTIHITQDAKYNHYMTIIKICQHESTRH